MTIKRHLAKTKHKMAMFGGLDRLNFRHRNKVGVSKRREDCHREYISENDASIASKCSGHCSVPKSTGHSRSDWKKMPMSSLDEDAEQNVVCLPCFEYSSVELRKSRVDGTGRHNFWLLELPREIVMQILLKVPASSLDACMHVDPQLRAIISDQYFLDCCTRRILGLSDRHDNDVKYSCLPKQVSLLMELWFLSHDTHSSLQAGTRSSLRRDSLFFPLNCFQHSLMTWLAQAAMSGTPLSNHVGYSTNDITCSLSKYIDHLPKCVQVSLTKLILAYPELIEKTVLATYLNLHKGGPKILQDVWHGGLPEDVKNKFPSQYCLEIICGKTVDSPSHMSALMICFSSDKWIIWTGSVTHFPGCRFKQTWNMVSMNAVCTISAISIACACVKELICERTKIEQNLNGQWKRQILYPGFCYHLHQSTRKALIASLVLKTGNEKYLPMNISSDGILSDFRSNHELHSVLCLSQDIAHGRLQDGFFCNYTIQSASHSTRNTISNRWCHSHGSPVCRKTFVLKHFSHTDLTQKRVVARHMSNRCQYFPCHNISHDFTRDSRDQYYGSQINDCTILSMTFGKLDQKQNLSSRLDALFRHEVLRYVCDQDSHQVLCPSCSKLWFPSTESLKKCISQIKAKDTVPKEFWPYHVLMDALVILSAMYG